MKIVFVSNYYNHHQEEFCYEMAKRCDFLFIETSTMRLERRLLGYETNQVPDYVISLNTNNEKECEELIDQADVVIIGGAPYKLIKSRIKNLKVTFRYCERPLKNGLEIAKYPFRLVKWRMQNPKNAPVYVLCASAFAASDFSKFNLYNNKMYKWGYFPQKIVYKNCNEMIEKKKHFEILWCGRFLEWKHPDDVIHLASMLKSESYTFHVNFIGRGEMEDELKEMVRSLGLEKDVSFLGSMKPAQVRTYMEQSGIYLFTSDRKEGWGAVLNEAMNSGCAVVASHSIGSVPYLIRNHENGIVYEAQNMQQLFECIKYLLDNPHEQKRLGYAAYETIISEWNAEVAAKKLLKIAGLITKGEKNLEVYGTGVCSKAENIKDDWFRKEC